jgi:hypothetical protein
MDEIKKNKSTLNNSDVQRLKMIKNIVPNFINGQPKNIYDKLRQHYKNDGTLSVLCYSLKKFYSDMKQDKKAEFFGNKGGELAVEVNKEESKNKLTNNEIKNWKTQEQILEIMNNIPLKTWTNFMRFTILNMCTKQPPLRAGVYNNMKYLFNEKKDNKKDNYCYLQDPKKGKSYYIVNDDKVSKFEKFKSKENRYIEITNPELIEFLLESHKAKPREYVICSNDMTPYDEGDMTKILLQRPFGLNFNILRSSYITAFYKNEGQITMEDKQELSRKMRNSVEKQMKNYLKVNPEKQQNKNE